MIRLLRSAASIIASAKDDDIPAEVREAKVRDGFWADRLAEQDYRNEQRLKAFEDASAFLRLAPPPHWMGPHQQTALQRHVANHAGDNVHALPPAKERAAR